MEIFLHIPKTAGSTLTHILRHQYPASNAIFHINHWDAREAAKQFHARCPDRQSAVRLVAGHVHFGIHRYFHVPTSYFTVLRDPVERVISHYYYVLGTPSHSEHRAVVSRRMSLKDYVASGAYPELDNGQARMLAGQQGLYDRTPFGRCGEDLLALAVENLDNHFAVVGLQEKFDDTLLLLQAAYGWAAPYYIARNVTRGKPRHGAITDDVRDVILDHNRIDAQLYAHVTRRFHEAVAGRGQAFAAKRQKFQAANTRYSQLYRWIERSGASSSRHLLDLLRAH